MVNPQILVNTLGADARERLSTMMLVLWVTGGVPHVP